MTQFLKKYKKPYFGAILGSLFPKILAKKDFSWEKKAPSVFKYSNYLSLCQKSEKTNEPFLIKTQNGWMD